jgi:hypothetical protein
VAMGYALYDTLRCLDVETAGCHDCYAPDMNSNFLSAWYTYYGYPIFFEFASADSRI